MPSKTTLMTIAGVLLALTVINNVPALGPVKKVVSGDSGWFG
jgi:hypothetical protein